MPNDQHFVMNILSYFDLNKTAGGFRELGGSAALDYKMKAEPPAAPVPEAPETVKPQARPMPLFEQLVLYAGVIIGVLFSSTVRQFQDGAVALPKLGFASVLIAAVVSLIIIPIVFDKLKVNPDAPFIIRFGLFVQHGAFWHILLVAIGKAIV
ncbi:hypothetical protein HY416_04260 [Candidatus Kaiserbacteria bacterium]|nr:hypothetical protein [Candidatus Kaiserbacteria bacterium]